ncbi:MAG: HEAT repeat domain-containing protein [Myxococcales bacterium]|nr:HEAT repeat domain-containing protein [Myxococcales bacterium]
MLPPRSPSPPSFLLTGLSLMLLGCARSEPPAQTPPASEEAQVTAAHHTEDFVVAPPPAAPDPLAEAQVRDILAREGTRSVCNDLNGCAMVNTLVALGPSAAPAIADAYRLSAGDKFWRFRLLEALGRIGAPESGSFLEGVLLHDDHAVARAEAALALGRGRFATSLASLRSVAARSPLPETEVLLAIGYAMTRLGDDLAGRTLIEAHLAAPTPVEPAPGERQAVRWDRLRPGLFAAGELRLKKALPVLARAAREADPFTRREAIVALPKLRDRAAIPTLIDALGDPVPRLRDEALAGLRSLTGFRNRSRPDDWRAWWEGERKGANAPAGAATAPR